MKQIGYVSVISGVLTMASLTAIAGEVVTGNIFVCRRPMLAGVAASLRSMQTPTNTADQERERRKLQELQRDQAENCLYVPHVEITGGGEDKVDIGWEQWCQEYTGIANDEEVFVAFGSASRTYGSCP